MPNVYLLKAKKLKIGCPEVSLKKAIVRYTCSCNYIHMFIQVQKTT